MPTRTSKHVSVPVLDVLRYLAEAGAQGMMAGDLARKFPLCEAGDCDPHQRRAAVVNTILASQQRQGRVRRSEVMEPTTAYHNVPSWRWFITPDGSQYHADGGWPAAVERNRAARRERERMMTRVAALREEARQEARRVIREAEQEIAQLVAGRSMERDALICELRATGLFTLEEIGTIVGLTRERVRQIVRQRNLLAVSQGIKLR